jgi:hypothetical protein
LWTEIEGIMSEAEPSRASFTRDYNNRDLGTSLGHQGRRKEHWLLIHVQARESHLERQRLR